MQAEVAPSGADLLQIWQWSSGKLQALTVPALTLPSSRPQPLQVPFQLQLAQVAELQHPLLRMLRITQLLLPCQREAVAEDEAGLDGEAALAAWQQREQQFASDSRGQLCALLAERGVQARLSSSLVVLSDLPAGVAVVEPQLLAGFRKLVCVQLRGNSSLLGIADSVPPSFFPGKCAAHFHAALWHAAQHAVAACSPTLGCGCGCHCCGSQGATAAAGH